MTAGPDRRGAVHAALRADRSVHAADRADIGSSTGQGGTTNYTVTGVAHGDEREPSGPGDGPGRVHVLPVDGERRGAARRAEVRRVHDDCGGDRRGGVHAGLHADRAVHAADGAEHRFEHGPRRHDKLRGLSVVQGTSVNLAAPATDPTGYTFSQWTVNGAAHTTKSITFTMAAGTTAVAQYTANALHADGAVHPADRIVIASNSADGGTTNYTLSSVAYGTSVNLQAPATDPAGYTFSQWTVNGAAQTSLQKSITFTMTGAATAAAQYIASSFTLTVQSTPPAGIVITSSTGHGGTTNYTASSVAGGASVNLVAPATDPAGLYTFSQWTVNGVAQTAGLQSITFTMTMAMRAEAQYTPNSGYTLAVQSTPPTGTVITSSTGHGGTTNYAIGGVAYGTSVNLTAPATDPTGYTFSQWTVNGTAQTSLQKSITFTTATAATAVAQYTRTRLHPDRPVHAAGRASIGSTPTAARRTTQSRRRTARA